MSDLEEEEDIVEDSEQLEETEDVQEDTEQEDEDIIAQGLSLLCRTGNGLGHSFVKLEVRNRNLRDITQLSSFIHLRFLDISSNHLVDLSPLASLTHLLWLKADGNQIQEFKGQPLGELPYLQWLSLANNLLHDMEGLEGQSLERLILNGNRFHRVSGLDYQKLPNLITLELRGNSLESTEGIILPNLRHLYLSQNRIKHLEGLDKLERLTTLHLRDNQIETLDGLSPCMKSLQYFNIRGNLVSTPQALQGIKAVAHTLQVLVLVDNPLSETEDYRHCVLTRAPFLERIDKEPVTAEERLEAKDAIKELKASNEEEAS